MRALGCVVVCVLMTGCRAKTVARTQALDFNQDVQPVLASNCFSCHGPDPAARKAGLRLDLEESAFRKRPGKPDAIVPGHPEQSELIRRIESTDAHHLMPQSPEGEAKPMKPEEIAILKEWVKEGAHYRPHWAFEEPARPVVPEAGTAIDGFILAKLTKEGLRPSPEADKATLIRRVTLDLTGLLPTPQEVDAFLRDGSPQAYERVVDRLLASPAYGEQRTRYWLDYARYADTYGLHYDNSRHAWPYRDYLIRSFNENKPFDQFAREQIAGDMLPAQSIDSIIGSGYVRSGVSSNEGGTIPEELRFNIARERAEAYGAAFMGLTVGCAVCHDHKYDPTTQKDFYQLSAFFNNMNEEPFNLDQPDWAPVLRIPRQQNLAAYNRALKQRSALLSELNGLRAKDREAVDRWLKSSHDLPVPVSNAGLQVRLRLDEGGGETLANSAPGANPASYPIGMGKPQWGETTWFWPDFRTDTTTHIALGQAGDFEWNQPFSTGGWMMVRSSPNLSSWRLTGTLLSKMDTTNKSRGWDLVADKGFISVDLVSEATGKMDVQQDKPSKPKPGQAPKPKLIPASKPKTPPPPPQPLVGKLLKVSTTKEVVTHGDWQHIFFTYDGSGKAAGIRIYIDGVAVPTRVVSDTLGRSSIKTPVPMLLGYRYPEEKPARDTRYQDVRLYARGLSAAEAKRLPYEDYVAEVVSKPATQWNGDQRHTVSQFYFTSVDARAKEIGAKVAELNTQMEKLSEGGDLTIVSADKPSLAYADILDRGIYSARKQRVEADVPHFLPQLPTGVPHTRLALADWTVSKNNPLTARVTVNRMWNEVFGTGLVETTEDFGIMGGRPTHPALLDWLAVEFRESGWNVKHMYKLMVMSAAYRQSAKTTPEQLNKDPRNLLLAHGPRFRMDAEMLRDIALQTSGLLVNKIGGPSVKPYQPDNVWTVGYPTSDTTIYVQEHGDALYRRSMYTTWKRMAMEPDMDAFDAPPRDTVCTRRQRTDTPLQALVTMNDVQWVEASRALAERVIVEGGKKPEERIRYMSEIVLSHTPTPQMQGVLTASLTQMEQHYGADPAAAQKLVAVGEKKRNPAIPAPELAAWTMVASEMMNLDETVNK
ncbi:Concanavalin A-like lectin/glucanases superfamily protein [Granulicella pectinivorans]|uniref:Concanavalin A-like lectin/glucanases superfamily protein n=2 Tax=Granulicella pectinivorans TaxID=474950 RepID=A0A1I6MBN0_9BACT|nr:Concanavalin A-like lectin/glucanases superfamily protein [Granulicella pectinivorans]